MSETDTGAQRPEGEVLGATGFTVTMALAMIDHLISERY